MGSLHRLCRHCQKHLGHDDPETLVSSTTPVKGCPVCLDLWQTSDEKLRPKLQEACEPYGGEKTNDFSTLQRQILLPGDIALRYYIAALISSNLGTGNSCSPFSKFQQALKDHLRSIMTDYINNDEKASAAPHPKQPSDSTNKEKPDCVTRQEQGYLSVHVLVTPSKRINRPSLSYPFITKAKRNNRKRFRGNDPTEKQGGDPLVNHQQRIEKEGPTFWTLSEVDVAWSEANVTTKQALCAWFQQEQNETELPDSTRKEEEASFLELHVVVYRQPFYLRALYTKARRDVSQTPFYVPDKDEHGKTFMKRLGVTSIEEQIVAPLQKACGGISRLNNNAEGGDVVFGMIKFHASGREDMNVRMTLPPQSSSNNDDDGDDANHVDGGVGGRPFCCLVIDALRMPTMSQLKTVVEEVNHTADDEMTIVSNGARTYGKNPFGVGISPCLAFVPADSFKNLQADTEEKVKYYGCHCWSKDVIPSEQYLNDALSKCPIELRQRTPVRVLHRRPNLFRKRHVRSLKATKIDDHYFRLNISTDAGTYVKEFVHGDLGRTAPSVSSLLGCKADILELDCEGIQQG